MKIVIAGAGDLGFHLARLLSIEQQDITLVDSDTEPLEYAETHLDVYTIRGDASSVSMLRKADVHKANLFLALTTSEKTNIIAAILAKKLGARQTIARVSNEEYVRNGTRETFIELGIDSIFSPRKLAALEIERLLNQANFTDVFDFEEGRFSVFGVTLDAQLPVVGKTLKEVLDMNQKLSIKPIAILRGPNTILPRDNTYLLLNDHLYFFAMKEELPNILALLGKKEKRIKKIMIAGGTALGYLTAKKLEEDYSITLVETSKEICKTFAENLRHTLVINGDPSNIDLLKEEGLEEMDAYVAVTPNTETNVLTSLMAKDLGIYKTIAMVENIEYTHISQNIGIDTIINMKLIAANNIFRFVRKGKIEAITSLHGVDAEIIEFVVHKENQLTRKPLRELHFPEKAIIGGVIRADDAFIPNGNSVLNLHDKVIVFAMPEAIGKLERLFR